ncbi:Uncharacterised protein [Bordetella ansorpii]|uniref:Uncharacterized protein n=1 Tax=Bordetella ansorpii TaxID=288768 RepID=A0A157SAM4_9BORD|nr:hypothetical protein [Bordetella ansorpii]SAI67472.1 Uncharacterised protein [Bordetella ansorpii]
MKTRFAAVAAALACLHAASAVAAADYATILTPAHPGMPLAHPIAPETKAPPPFSLIADRPVKPAYVPGLPGLPQYRMVTDDFGRKIPKYDGVFIRQSRVENGEVVIPAGGLYYLEDTWGGEVALRGEQVPVLGRMTTYIDYDMSIEVQENVTIPAGGSVAVGGQVYHYYATVGHETTTNHALHVRSISGTDWEWAFGNPILSASQTNWWGTRFNQLYNQGQAREVTPRQMVFDWLSGVRTDRMVYAEETVHKGLAAAGEQWQVGARTVRVAAVDAAKGTVSLEVLQDGKVTASRTLGPIRPERLIEDTEARKALVFEDGDMVAFLSPWPTAFEGDRANLKVYGKAFSVRYGQDYVHDARFTGYPVGCPTGHEFGFMLVNKEEIRLKPGESYSGPEGYFKVVVDSVADGKVTGWHVQDRDGARSINLGGPDVTNVDLVLGQGRVAGQAILFDVGRAMLARTYAAAQRADTGAAAVPATPAPAAAPATAPAAQSGGGLSPSLIIVIAILALACLGVGFEWGRRRRS